MTEITIPDDLVNEINTLIQDDAIKREYRYKSFEDFVIRSLADMIMACKDNVGIPID